MAKKLGLLTALLVGLSLAIIPYKSGEADAPAEHEILSVVGDTFECDGTTYTITQGSIRIVSHETITPQGNEAFTVTITPLGVFATDGTTTVRVSGAEWIGGTFNANTGGGVFTLTGKFQLVAPGQGTLDSVNVVLHFSPNGDFFEFDFGTCEVPE
jgi:hypothetical protein